MDFIKRVPVEILFVVLVMFCPQFAYAEGEPETTKELQEIIVAAPKVRLVDSQITGPNPELTYKSTISEEEIRAINAVTMVDTLKYMPDTFIRQRFIGDANAPVGMGGTGYFQVGDNMVFADGFPLHFLLRTTFNGSPRWNLISSSEVTSTDITYGPFSAMYPGNAMGGVVDIHTRMPEKLQGSIESLGFLQKFKAFGADGVYGGFKTHGEYGDKVGKLSVFAFYDHVSADSQPMGNYFRATGAATGSNTTGPLRSATTQTPVTGVFRTPTLNGSDSVMYGDTGTTAVTDHLFKIKAQYEFSSDLVGRVMATFLDHYEDTSNANPYMRDANGQRVYGGNFQYNGVAFTAVNSNFASTHFDRQGVNAGLGLKGNLSDGWKFDSVFSFYTEPRDLNSTSNVNPGDPTYNKSGTVTDIHNIGWQTFDLTLGNQSFLKNENLNFFTGYHFDHYSIGISQWNSNNWLLETKDSFRASNGGQTQTSSIFAQGGWKFLPDWMASLGGRQEWWNTYNGFNNTATVTNNMPDRDYSKFSPKFALEYGPAPWYFQVSLAQAWRFPMPGEMYETITPTNNATITTASNMRPENGFAKGFLVRRTIDRGEVSVNFFEKDIRDLIYSQVLFNSLGAQATTFMNIDRARSRGIEVSIKQRDFLVSKLDANVNVTYVDSKILENDNNTAFVGKSLQLLPSWRLNSLNTYHVTEQWDVSGGARYSTQPFFSFQNNDYISTFGSADGYILGDIKTVYRWTWEKYLLQASAGIDNINNYTYFYNHPFPQRTYVMGLKASF